MRNILFVQLETKVALAIVAIVIAIFMVTIFRNLDNFDKFIKQTDSDRSYEEIRLQKNP